MPKVQLNSQGLSKVSPNDYDAWLKSLRRVWFHGDPFAGKTTGLMTMPPRRAIIACPGEFGHTSIQEDENTAIWTYEIAPNCPAKAIWDRLQYDVGEILKGQHGEFTMLALDGAHKIYDLIFQVLNYPADESLWGEKSYGKGQALARTMFIDLLTRVSLSPIKYVACTSYAEKEIIDASVSLRDTAIWPDLPGKMAKRIMGLFPVVLYVKRTGTAKEEFYWEIKASGSLRGVGIHVPMKFRKNLPRIGRPSAKS